MKTKNKNLNQSAFFNEVRTICKPLVDDFDAATTKQQKRMIDSLPYHRAKAIDGLPPKLSDVCCQLIDAMENQLQKRHKTA